MLDSGVGASVCSPNDFPNIAIDTKSIDVQMVRAAHQTQHVRGHVIFSFEEAGDGVSTRKTRHCIPFWQLQ
eukprot:6492049-Amphidinium_carterae.1